MLTLDEVKSILAAKYAEGIDSWMAAVNTVLVDLISEHMKTRAVIAEKIAPEMKNFRTIFDVLQAQFAGAPGADATADAVPDGAPAVAGSEPPMSADQTATEAMMDAAAGPREGEAPTQSPGAPMTIAQRLKVPPKGGSRTGAPAPAPVANIRGDQSDEDQAAVEAMMNQTAGPRGA